MNVLAFSPNLNPGHVPLPAVFASDIGHWDVRDMREVLPEAYELVEHGQISDDDFAHFVFINPVKLWTSMNPEFFAGTSVESAVARLSAEPAGVSGTGGT